MKPTTPQEFAVCYGTFIADLKIANQPTLNQWFYTYFKEVDAIYKLNPALFSAYSANISSFPSKPKAPYNESTSDRYNRSLELAWTALTIDLKSAMTCSEIDPSKTKLILAAFNALYRSLQTRVR